MVRRLQQRDQICRDFKACGDNFWAKIAKENGYFWLILKIGLNAVNYFEQKWSFIDRKLRIIFIIQNVSDSSRRLYLVCNCKKYVTLQLFLVLSGSKWLKYHIYFEKNALATFWTISMKIGPLVSVVCNQITNQPSFWRCLCICSSVTRFGKNSPFWLLFKAGGKCFG